MEKEISEDTKKISLEKKLIVAVILFFFVAIIIINCNITAPNYGKVIRYFIINSLNIGG